MRRHFSAYQNECLDVLIVITSTRSMDIMKRKFAFIDNTVELEHKYCMSKQRRNRIERRLNIYTNVYIYCIMFDRMIFMK